MLMTRENKSWTENKVRNTQSEVKCITIESKERAVEADPHRSEDLFSEKSVKETLEF